MKNLFLLALMCLFVFSNGSAAQDKTGTDETKTTEADKPRRKSFRPTKDQIAQAQTKLKTAGLYAGDADGRYNSDFRTAVRNFQAANGLKRKGSMNRATLEKMGIALTEEQKLLPVNPKDLASEKNERDDRDEKDDRPKRSIFRATAEQIAEVQKMLKTKGLFAGEADGKLNPATRAAVREWQGQNNVKKTGTLNKETLEAMGIALTDKQKSM